MTGSFAHFARDQVLNDVEASLRLGLRKPLRKSLLPDRLRGLAERAIVNGAERQGVHRWVWRLHGDCTNPGAIDFYSRGERGCAGRRDVKTGRFISPTAVFKKRDMLREPGHSPHLVTIYHRCRKCRACRKARARKWMVRGAEEIRKAERTWLVTWTAEIERHFLYQLAAEQRCERSGVAWGELTADQRFARVARQMMDEGSAAIKRLRSKVRARGGEWGTIRYQLVVEKHESGRPHLHLLVHESTEGDVKRRDLGTEKGKTADETGCVWKHGFAGAKLSPDGDAKAAFYVAKYISDSEVRVRASRRYGRPNGDEAEPGPSVWPVAAAMKKREAAERQADRGEGLQFEILSVDFLDEDGCSDVSPLALPASEASEYPFEDGGAFDAWVTRPLPVEGNDGGDAGGAGERAAGARPQASAFVDPLDWEARRIAHYRSRAPGGVRSPPAFLLN